MKLGTKQRMFTRMIADLIQYAYNAGYELTFGDTYRDPRVHGDIGEKKSYSSSKSLHKLRLACDFNLFINGAYIMDSVNPAWDDLHNYWESLGGAKRIKDDANHFSIEHEGRI